MQAGCYKTAVNISLNNLYEKCTQSFSVHAVIAKEVPTLGITVGIKHVWNNMTK